MPDKKCYIVGAGVPYRMDFVPRNGDYVISADGGFMNLQKVGITCDLAVGDFDSMGSIPSHPNMMILPKEKDDTDTLFAVREGIKRGYKEFHIYGGTGGRTAHTIANIQILNFLAEKGFSGYLYGENEVMTVIKNRTLALPLRKNGYISVFSCGERAEHVDISGLKYEVSDAVISNDYPIGVSNEFVGKESSITVGCGMLLICISYEEQSTVI